MLEDIDIIPAHLCFRKLLHHENIQRRTWDHTHYCLVRHLCGKKQLSMPFVICIGIFVAGLSAVAKPVGSSVGPKPAGIGVRWLEIEPKR